MASGPSRFYFLLVPSFPKYESHSVLLDAALQRPRAPPRDAPGDMAGDHADGGGEHGGVIGEAEHRHHVGDEVERQDEIGDRAQQRDLDMARRLRSKAQ